jgi:hypothetical protein
MKRMIIALLMAVFLTGCARCSNQISHVKSSMFGLKRHIVLYSASGQAIKEWTCDCQIEDQGGSVRFLDNGRAVTISGTFIIEEL